MLLKFALTNIESWFPPVYDINLLLSEVSFFFAPYRTEKEMNRRKDMLSNLRSKVSQMASTLNLPNIANRDSLLGPEIKPADAMSRTTGLDNYGLVGLQRQIMKGKFKYLLQNDILLLSFLFQMSPDMDEFGYMSLKQNKMRALIA